MKRILSILAFSIFLFFGNANATLTKIGTANYLGNDYNLIYEDDSIFGGLIWLDYSRQEYWQNQVEWAAGLNVAGTLIYNIDQAFNVSWNDEWRLPVTDDTKANLTGPWGTESGDGYGYGWGGADEFGNYDYYRGFNMVNSEMGHLYYISLGNKGRKNTEGTDQLGYGLVNTGDFYNLQPDAYWSGTEHPLYSLYPDATWDFNLFNGYQGSAGKNYRPYYALAVRPAEVSAVPEPTTMLLLGSGLIGLLWTRQRM